MKVPTAAMLLAYVATVRRVEQMIDQSDSSEHTSAWRQAMAAIDDTYDCMMDIPYSVIDPQMHCLDIGRQIWRLFHALQLLAEWRLTMNSAVPCRDVVTAFNEIGDEGFGRDTIFPVCAVSPAAQRAILAMPFFADRMRGWIVEGIGTESPTMITITGSMGMTAERIPLNVQLDPMRQIWDVVRD